MASSNSNGRASLKGVQDARYNGKVTQYRGIQYATIKKRFAKPILNKEWEKQKDSTKFGPRCPQVNVDVRQLMQIPKDLPKWDPETEDELKCANLTLTCPSDFDLSAKKLPVLIWIHGGSQMNSFGSPGQMLGDTTPLVAQSIEMGKPVIFISINYRLNIFGFGGNEGELNLDLQDQRIAIDWVRRYIEVFGGDANEITVGGESAGSLYTHALVASGSDVARAIMLSGSLYSTPPQPDKKGLGLLGLIEGNLQLIQVEKGNMNPGESTESSVEGARPATLVQTLKDLKITRKWLWDEASLKDWQNDAKVFGRLKGVMYGDCEQESVLFLMVVSALKGPAILNAFNSASSGAGQKLADAYGIDPSSTTQSHQGTLNFLNDMKYAFANHSMTQNVNKAGGKAYRHFFDQVNPFAKNPSHAVAHHAIDLFAVSGGYDEHAGPEMQAVGKQLRHNWILFLNGEEPWNSSQVYAYGPKGETGVLTQEEVASRRREDKFEVLREAGLDTLQEIYSAIMAAGQTADD